MDAKWDLAMKRRERFGKFVWEKENAQDGETGVEEGLSEMGTMEIGQGLEEGWRGG